jgi:hypothetical protein
MHNLPLRNAFLALHLTLGLVILFESVQTLAHTLGAPADHGHLMMVAGVESVAALLFLWPRTLRIGGGALVLILTVAAVAHIVRGEFPAAVMVYAVATFFVCVHGSAWPAKRYTIAH